MQKAFSYSRLQYKAFFESVHIAAHYHHIQIQLHPLFYLIFLEITKVIKYTYKLVVVGQ